MDKNKLTQGLKKALEQTKQDILPGFETGKYQTQPAFDPAELVKPTLEDPMRRDNRISIRVSGADMTELHKQALAEGVPVQSFIGSIVHQYASGRLLQAELKVPPRRGKITAAENDTSHKRD